MVEGVGPDPGKIGVNPDPVIFDAPNENPDEVADVNEVKLDMLNRSGPEGGAGIQKEFPGPELEEVAPDLGVSQGALLHG